MSMTTEQIATLVATIVASQATNVAVLPTAPTTTPAKADFDFAKFNELVNGTQPGLKLALAENLLKDAIRGFEYYKNSMVPELKDIGAELTSFRVKYKASRAQADSGASALQATKQEVEARVANATK